jgi:hypothetical protein
VLIQITLFSSPKDQIKLGGAVWIISERLKDTFVRIHRSAWNSDPKQKLQKNKTIQKSDLHDSI